MRECLRAPRGNLGAFLLVVVSAVLSGCGGGSGGAAGTAADEDLVVLGLSHVDRTDVYRDQRLEITLSAPVDPATVSNRTVRVLTGPDGRTSQPGALSVDGNRIYFEPTRTQQALDRSGPIAPLDLPYGFAALANYQVHVPATPGGKVLTNLAGDPIKSEFIATFATGDIYAPESAPVAPEFIGVRDGETGEPTGRLGFIPAPFEETAPDSPAFGESVVAHNAEIVLQFSEVLDPATVVPGETVIVRNMTPPAGSDPIPVPGTMRAARDGTCYYFVPSFHYGRGPFTIEVEVTRDITDLTGQRLLRPVKLRFLSAWEPDVKTIAFLEENFNTNAYEDQAETTADWNSPTRGELRGGTITTSTVVVNYAPGLLTFQTRTPYPLVSVQTQTNPGTGALICSGWPQGIRFQTSYTPADLGSDGSITALAWGPDSNSLFAATYPNVEIRLGHTPDASGVLDIEFEKNFEDGVPLPHFSGSYSVPQRANINPPDVENGYWPYPSLSTPFDYDGLNAVVVELRCTAGGTCQTHRGWFNGAVAGAVRRYAVANDRTAEKDNFTQGGLNSPEVVYDMQFTKRRRITRARSRWFQARTEQPDYADPIVTPPVQSGGASYVLEFQGADGMPNPLNMSLLAPDPGTETPWSTNIQALDGKRFVRFRFVLEANLASEAVPRISSLVIPYEM